MQLASVSKIALQSIEIELGHSAGVESEKDCVHCTVKLTID